MLHWKDQIRVHETLVPTDSHFYEHQERIMVENVASSVVPLRAMKDQSDQHFSHIERELKHEQ